MTGALHLVFLPCAGLWLALATCVGLVSPSWRDCAFWSAVLSGVPLLGLVTYDWGPGAGMAAFLLGLLVLIRAPAAVDARRRRRAAVMMPPVRSE